MTKKDTPFGWTEKTQKTFDQLQSSLCSAPILAYPRPDALFILDCDASNVGIGSVLQQVQDGKEKVIAYASKRLDKTQQRYSVTRRELLAMVTFIYQLKHYLAGNKFIIRTDHGSTHLKIQQANWQDGLHPLLNTILRYWIVLD